MAIDSMIAAPLSMAMACPRVTRLEWNGAEGAASWAMREFSFGPHRRVHRAERPDGRLTNSSNDKWEGQM